MMLVVATNPPSFSSENPFILVRGYEVRLTYSIDGRTRHIEGQKYETYDRIFEDGAREWDSIADGAAAELVQLSGLPEDVLAEIWESTLRASFISTSGSYDTQPGYLSKDEFFVLLSELQFKLALSDETFSNIFLSSPMTPRTRRNPFSRNSLLETPTQMNSPDRAPPIPPKILEKDEWRNTSGGSEIVIYPDFTATGRLDPVPGQYQHVADGYSEYIRSFGSAHLAQSSSQINTSCDFILPVKPRLTISEATESLSSDKEVIVEKWTPALPNIQDMEEEEAFAGPAVSSHGVGHSEETEVSQQDRSGLEVVPTPTRWNADDFGSVRSLGLNDNPAESVSGETSVVARLTTSSCTRLRRSISTVESDVLALERIKAVNASTNTLRKRNSTIGTALRVVRKKTMYFKSKPAPIDPTKAASGYSYTALAEALQDAVAEGNMSLVVSLFNLGVNVNYSSVKDRVYHNILQVAVAFGHAEIVDYFIDMGADGISVDNALITAFFADHIDLAIKLAPHANVYHLRPFDCPGPEYQKLSASSLGRVVRDRTMSSKSRSRMLQCFMRQKYFDANKAIFQAYDAANNRLFEFSTLATLVSQLDIEGVEKILPRLGAVKRHTVRNTLTDRLHQMGAICCIRPSHWQLSPDTAFSMLQILVNHSAEIGDIAYWPGQGPMSPLASAVAGGSLEGVSFLLARDADPECLVYQLQQNGKESEGYSALGWAAVRGRLDICTLLVDAGATPWRISFKGYTPLYLACRGGYIEVVEYLLSLDVERSMVVECLIAAVKGDEPRIVDVLLTIGATIGPDTWIAVMAQKRKPRQRGKVLEIIDLLLSQESIILEEPVLAAIDSGNFAGLSRILERRNGVLDFDKNAVFGNWRWPPGLAGVDCRDRNCLYYADSRQARDFVALLMSYGWANTIAPWPGMQVGYPNRQ